ncbi:sulfite exporter TauE/SafE family protein [Patescibacteria group bacterium]|nr:sulfite exporter TauE/SafE family protein [Patescibacteria group bacterium]
MLSFFIIIILISIIAGIIGAMVGVGGGIIIIPILVLLFHIDIKMAIGASIVSVIATSSGAASAYLKDNIINLKAGMFLEIATTIGAISGALILSIINPEILLFIFPAVLISSTYPMIKNIKQDIYTNIQNDKISNYLELNSSYYDKQNKSEIKYNITHTKLGLFVMYIAGLLSGLLGIGSGVFKVLAMDNIMKMPIKVSTTTSNFMIGVTAAASAVIYLVRGYINPYIALPVMIGIVIGAFIGTKILFKSSNIYIKTIFIIVIFAISVEMIARGLHIL